jgi:hypothetical protein
MIDLSCRYSYVQPCFDGVVVGNVGYMCISLISSEERGWRWNIASQTATGVVVR